MERGLVHIYYGDGKGKTTAAVGLAVRCAGGGGRVLFFQFMKGDKSGERKVFEKIKEIEMIKGYDNIKFSCDMTEEERKRAGEFYKKGFEEIIRESEGYDMIILDEILHAIGKGFIKRERLIDFIDREDRKAEIVITGRGYDDELWKRGDYITEMRKIKHPFDKGIRGRAGIEW